MPTVFHFFSVSSKLSIGFLIHLSCNDKYGNKEAFTAPVLGWFCVQTSCAHSNLLSTVLLPEQQDVPRTQWGEGFGGNPWVTVGRKLQQKGWDKQDPQGLLSRSRKERTTAKELDVEV